VGLVVTKEQIWEWEELSVLGLGVGLVVTMEQIWEWEELSVLGMGVWLVVNHGTNLGGGAGVGVGPPINWGLGVGGVWL